MADQVLPLGDRTRTALLAYLAERQGRWPHTVNRHVFVSRRTANGTGPVSTFYIKRHLTLHGVSLERIRIDRCLHEALANGVDPLYLATLFGLHSTTAMRYAIGARRILDDTLDRPTANGQVPSNPSPADPGVIDL